MAVHEDTQKSSWVLVDATVFAAFAGLTEDVWTRLVGGFLDHGSAGAARIESVRLTSSANTSLLKVALKPTASLGWRRAVAMNVHLSEFRNGNITELLLPLSVVQEFMSEKGFPRNLTLRKGQLSHGDALGLDRLLATAESYLRELRIQSWEREATREWEATERRSGL